MLSVEERRNGIGLSEKEYFTAVNVKRLNTNKSYVSQWTMSNC
jgi:hypothetical protein